jgi:hypothetical protein
MKEEWRTLEKKKAANKQELLKNRKRSVQLLYLDN